MLDLTDKSLPNTIAVGGRLFSIYTDYRVWMRFELSLQDCRDVREVEVGYLFKNDMPLRCDVREILAFSRPENPLPRPVRGTSSSVITLDWRIDSDLIYAAFMQQYGIDLIDVPELHWHKFLALVRGLHGTKLDEVMGYRCYERQTHKDIDVYEELREAWEIRRESAEDQALLDDFNKQFGG